LLFFSFAASVSLCALCGFSKPYFENIKKVSWVLITATRDTKDPEKSQARTSLKNRIYKKESGEGISPFTSIGRLCPSLPHHKVCDRKQPRDCKDALKAGQQPLLWLCWCCSLCCRSRSCRRFLRCRWLRGLYRGCRCCWCCGWCCRTVTYLEYVVTGHLVSGRGTSADCERATIRTRRHCVATHVDQFSVQPRLARSTIPTAPSVIVAMTRSPVRSCPDFIDVTFRIHCSRPSSQE